jgi:uncharacterized membrane protein HdeD (DUF308 family)
MSGIKIFAEILYIVCGIAAIVFVFVLEMEAYYALIGVGLIIWGIYDIYKETRDISKESEVSRLSKEREEISKKLNKEK